MTMAEVGEHESVAVGKLSGKCNSLFRLSLLSLTKPYLVLSTDQWPCFPVLINGSCVVIIHSGVVSYGVRNL